MCSKKKAMSDHDYMYIKNLHSLTRRQNVAIDNC